ncbi:MAG: hypothetical protein J6E46_05535, partial [Faecalicoccus sp.]|nr:hypothetical protein [Faecalicoccus sp.]
KSAEAYIGKLLARDKEPDFASWVATQKDKYSKADRETLYACDEETTHIVKMVQANVLDGYLSADEIRRELNFDRSYLSELSFRKEQRDFQLKELSQDRLLYRARQNGKGDYGKKVEDGISQIKTVMDQRVSNAEAKDNANIERIKEEYAKHLQEADKKVVELNQDAHKRQEEDYQNASALLNNAKDASDFKKAMDALIAMNGYKDTSELSKKSAELMVIDEDYIKAVGMMESNSITELNNAISIFNKNIDWKDSKEKIHACNNKIAAVKRTQEKQKKTRIKIGAAVAAIIALVLIYTQIIVPKVIIPNQKYNEAVELMNNGNYEEAVAAFKDMNGYKDSDDKIKECIKEANSKVEVGSTYFFGNYEQDGNEDKGKEPIAWQVLAKEDNKILIVSKYGLDCKKYNDERTDVTWETSTLRNWLDSTFIDTAFSEDEKSQIQTTTVTADKNLKYDTNPGNDTQDQVFLLSIQEVEKYLDSNHERTATATVYATNNGAYIGSSGNCYWWLRSPGTYSTGAASVSDDGSIYYRGFDVNSGGKAVRPALWLGIE